MIDFNNLPDADVFSIPAFETVVAENIAVLQQIDPTYVAVESDDYMPLIEAWSYRELHLLTKFNNKIKSLLLPFARGTDLDLVAASLYNEVRLIGEDDTAFMRRILKSLDGYSTAGSLESYEFHAFSVSAIIDDVKAVSPTKGVVDVFIASYENDITAELVTQVELALNEKKVRPVTDAVNVRIATLKTITITAEIQLFDLADRAEVEALIRNKFQFHLKIKQALPFSSVITGLKQAGVYDALPSAPAGNTYAADGERIVIDALNLTFTQAPQEAL